MVNSCAELGMADKDVLYEEIHKEELTHVKPDVLRKLSGDSQDLDDLTTRVSSTLTADMNHKDDCSFNEDLYEVIPAHFAPEYTAKTPPVLTSDDGKMGPKERRLHCQRTNSLIGCASASDIDKTEYAEIAVAHKVTEIMPSRPTRESDNPILREDFAENLSFLPNSREVRSKGLSLHSQNRLLDRDRRCPANSWPESARQRDFLQSNSTNTSPTISPQQSPHTQRAMPLYMNMEFPFIERDQESRRSSVSSSGEKQSLSSFECDMSSPEYENVKKRANVDFDMQRPASSLPVDIVYSDLDFREEANDNLGKCASSPGVISKFIERSKSHSSSPRLPSRDYPTRPKSMLMQSARTTNYSGALGNFMARYVGKATVQRSSEKTLHSAVGDITDSTKPENCVSVIVEIDSDKMRFSTNCEPWELIASFKLEDIGCASVCEHDRTVCGVLESAPGREATCYVLRSPNAEAIYKVLADNFKAPKSKRLEHNPWLKPRPSGVVAFDNITYVGCLKVKKSYLVIKDSIAELLEKVNPKEFKSVNLEVHQGEIRLADASSEKPLGKHVLAWILSIGVFDRDPRLFGYIVTEAKQGEKTRMFCHAFRCGRITTSVAATEAIRLGCQASYTNDKRNATLGRRRSSNSVSSHGSSGESPGSLVEDHLDEKPESPTDHRTAQRPTSLRHFPSMPLLRKISKKKSSSSEMDAPSESCENESEDPLDEKSESPTDHKASQRPASLRHFPSMPMLRKLSKKKSSSSEMDGAPSESCEKGNSPIEELAETATLDAQEEFEFDVKYLCSTVINPPLRPKHLRECVKQYQKQQVKAHKRHGITPSSSEVTLTVEEDGVHMIDPQRRDKSGQMFFPFVTINCVKSHPENPQYFAFSTAVSGDTKHKCHLFLREGVDDSVAVIQAFECFIQL